MSHSRQTRSIGIDPIKLALGVFVVLGVLLTVLAGYALLSSLAGGAGALPPELAMTVVFAAVLVATGAAVRRFVPQRS
ncbi:hypothetical protein [Halobellus rufus]|uniref:hypothetical protein n=1 Tax=Halobellus rufus TaxID=1448860 RepID=UPI000679E86D|nr:hypothetical protein [Halobellus rufus]